MTSGSWPNAVSFTGKKVSVTLTNGTDKKNKEATELEDAPVAAWSGKVTKPRAGLFVAVPWIPLLTTPMRPVQDHHHPEVELGPCPDASTTLVPRAAVPMSGSDVSPLPPPPPLSLSLSLSLIGVSERLRNGVTNKPIGLELQKIEKRDDRYNSTFLNHQF